MSEPIQVYSIPQIQCSRCLAPFQSNAAGPPRIEYLFGQPMVEVEHMHGWRCPDTGKKYWLPITVLLLLASEP